MLCYTSWHVYNHNTSCMPITEPHTCTLENLVPHWPKKFVYLFLHTCRPISHLHCGCTGQAPYPEKWESSAITTGTSLILNIQHVIVNWQLLKQGIHLTILELIKVACLFKVYHCQVLFDWIAGLSQVFTLGEEVGFMQRQYCGTN